MAFLEAYNFECELPTGDGNTVSIDIDGETRTPIAGLFMFSNCTAYGSETANQYWFVVMATADKVGFSTAYALNAQATSAVYGLHWHDVTATTYRAEIWDESGTRISRVEVSNDAGTRGPKAGGWVLEHDDDNLTTVSKVVGTLFFGEGRNADLIILPDSTTYPYTATVGFEPKVGVWFGGENAGGPTSAYAGLGYHYGTTQASMGRIEKDNVGTTELAAYVSDASAVTRYQGSTFNRTRGTITEVTSTGLTIDETIDTGGSSLACMGLVFDLDSAQSAYVGVEDSFSSATTGDYSVSMGFQPGWVQFVTCDLDSVNTEVTSKNAGTVSVMQMDSAGVGSALAVVSEDGVGTTDSGTYARYDTGGAQWGSGYNNSGSANGVRIYSYTGVPFTSSGFTLRDGEAVHYKDAARKWPVLALQAATPTFTGYSSSLKLLLDASNRSATSTEVNGEAGVTFTSTGGPGRTFWGATGLLETTTGNELAWNTDPVTGVVGLQCHAAYVNEIRDSEDVEGTGWTPSGTLAAVVQAEGPDGIATSAQTIEDTDAAASSVYFSPSLAAAAADETWTVSVFIKKDSIEPTTRWPALQVEFLGGVAERLYVGLDTKTGATASAITGGGASTIVSASAKDVGWGWWLHLTGTNSSDASNTTAQARLYPARGNNANLTSINNAAVGAITYFGIQLTKSPVPLPYFKTTGTADGPSADQPIATGFTGYNNDGGVFYVDVTTPAGDLTANTAFATMQQTSSNNDHVEIYNAGSTVGGWIRDGSSSVYLDQAPTNPDIGGRFRGAIRIAANNFRHAVNGLFAAADVAGTVPTDLDEIQLGKRPPAATGEYPLLYIHGVRYYDEETIPNGGPQAGEDDLSLYNLSMGLVTEEAAAAATPAAGGAGSGMKGKGKAFARAKGTPRYPRRVVINGQVYTVRNPQEEHALLQLLLQREKEQLDLVEAQAIDAPMPESAKRKRVNIRKLEARLATAEANTVKWDEVLDDWDEDIIMLLSN